MHKKFQLQILCRFDVYLVDIFLGLFQIIFFLLLFPRDQLFLFQLLLSYDWSSSYTFVLLSIGEMGQQWQKNIESNI